MTRLPYASVVGSLIYSMICTRPDIIFVMCLVSRYQSDYSNTLASCENDLLIPQGHYTLFSLI